MSHWSQVDWQQPVNLDCPLNRGLISWWLAGENPFWGGGRFLDLMGRNHGTLTNGPTWGGALGRPGGFGALNFTAASSQYVPIGTGVTNTLKLHVSGWAYPTAYNAFRYIATRDINSGSDRCWVLGHGDGGATYKGWYAVVWNSGGSLVEVFDSGGLHFNANEWSFVELTFDGSTASLLANGKLVNSQSLSGDLRSSASAPVEIGRQGNATSYWNGYLDDISIRSEIVTGLYQDSLRGYPLTLNWLQPRVAVAQAAAATTFSQVWWNSAYDYSGIGV